MTDDKSLFYAPLFVQNWTVQVQHYRLGAAKLKPALDVLSACGFGNMLAHECVEIFGKHLHMT